MAVAAPEHTDRTLEGVVAPSEAARELGISYGRLRQMRRAGQIDALVTPLGELYWRQDIERMAAERAQQRAARGA